MKSILLAINKKHLRDIVYNALNERAYNVTLVSTGQEVLDNLRAFPHTYSIVCSEVILPKTDVAKLMQEIHSNPDTADLPFIFLTYPPNDYDSYVKWKSSNPRYNYTESERTGVVVIHDGPPNFNVLTEDILAVISVAIS